jgi:hypothetical protein
MISAEIADAARTLLADVSALEKSPTRIAARAVEACEQLSRHLARLLGDLGTRALFTRSLVLTRARFPWIANAVGAAESRPDESPWTPLRASLELQDPDTAVEAYADFLSTFVQLLGKLIGDQLVSHLLHEVWPRVFPRAVAAKEPM